MPQSYKTISNSANLRNSKLIFSIKSLAISLITAICWNYIFRNVFSKRLSISQVYTKRPL